MRTFGCTFVPGEPVGWVVVGVAGEIDRPSTEIEPREVEPKKVGRFRWIDPSRPPADLYPASRALLDYGDSMSDVPLFDAVGYRISINGDHHLRDLCDVDVRGDDLWAAYHHARRYIDQSAA